ncbi:MAG: hypothetical protein ABIH49_02730 [archaeon]
MEEEVIKIKIPDFFSKGNFTQNLRRNPWMASTCVLGIFILILLGNSFLGGLKNPGGLTGNFIKSDDAGQKLVDFLNQNTNFTVTLEDAADENGLYRIDVNYEGEVIPLYVTKDGNYFIQNLIPLTSFWEENLYSGS